MKSEEDSGIECSNMGRSEVSGVLFEILKKYCERRFIISKLLGHFPEISRSLLYDIIRDRTAYHKFRQGNSCLQPWLFQRYNTETARILQSHHTSMRWRNLVSFVSVEHKEQSKHIQTNKQNKFRCLSPQLNYTNGATEACQRNQCQHLLIEWCRVVSVTDPYCRILCFLD
jgi:hypothetical protein